MAMFLKHWRHKPRSSHVGGSLRCSACDIEEDDGYGNNPRKRPRLRFLHTVGSKLDKKLDVYECEKCHRIVRYVVTPSDPHGRGMSRKDEIADYHSGMHHKEKARLDKIKRARKRDINWMPGLGRMPLRKRSSKPKD